MKPCNLRKCIVRRDGFQNRPAMLCISGLKYLKLEALETKGPRIERGDGPSESFHIHLELLDWQT